MPSADSALPTALQVTNDSVELTSAIAKAAGSLRLRYMGSFPHPPVFTERMTYWPAFVGSCSSNCCHCSSVTS